jgi:hypothetical protein
MVRERSIESSRALERFAEAMMGLTKTWKDFLSPYDHLGK